VDLGAFSVSLAVDDMSASRAFYEKLGFAMIGGDGVSWTIMANASAVIGLFHGMFEGNILTFNPGWEGAGQPSSEFTDVRVLRDRLAASGLAPDNDTTEEAPNGPASFTLIDPDGNVILIDQHI
jgi:catechol 2,3-dioxygenase-like lactoylglutathione lyase family enzyme